MPLKPLYQATENELYHLYNEETEDKTRTLNFFFKEEYYYKECFERIKKQFKVEANGLEDLNGNSVYRISVLSLTRGEGNAQHGFSSYEYGKNYIRVYWNNDNKKVIFYTE